MVNQATGADQAQAGSLPGVGSVTGRGIGMALIDSGYSRHRALAGQVPGERGLHRVQRHRRRRAGPRHARRGPGRRQQRGVQGRGAGRELVSLKVLGADGSGRTSDVIRAIDFAIEHKEQFGLRVINLSLGRPVFES